MVFLLLLIRVGLSTLFLSTGLSKLDKPEEHIAIVKDYRIMPKQWVRFSAQIEMIGEIIIGGMLLIGLFQSIIPLVSVLLLLIYNFAMVKSRFVCKFIS